MAKVVVYSSRTGRIRRIISDDVLSDEDLLDRHPVGVGESAQLDLFTTTIEEMQAELSALTGLIPTNDRYVALDAGFVVDHFLLADPDAGDSIEGRTLVANAIAGIGWRQLSSGAFQRSLPEIDTELTSVQNARDIHASQEFRDAHAAQPDGLAPEEIAIELARLNAEFGQLTAERAARAGPRT